MDQLNEERKQQENILRKKEKGLEQKALEDLKKATKG